MLLCDLSTLHTHNMDGSTDFDAQLLENFERLTSLLADKDNGFRVQLYAYYAVLRIKQYQHWGRMEDLEEAIAKEKWAVEGTAREDDNSAARLNNLGVMLQSRYGRIDKMEDLEKAIGLARQAVRVT